MLQQGWSHLHLRGSLNAFRKNGFSRRNGCVYIGILNGPDTYSWWNLEDLKRFYDRYLKGIRNGWEMTPKVRIEVMDAYDHDFQVNRPENEFPIKRTEYKKLYLDGSNNTLADNPVEVENSVRYDSIEGETTFDIMFTQDVELTGYMKRSYVGRSRES